jgi:hypothetical protein
LGASAHTHALGTSPRLSLASPLLAGLFGASHTVVRPEAVSAWCSCGGSKVSSSPSLCSCLKAFSPFHHTQAAEAAEATQPHRTEHKFQLPLP